MCRWVALWTLDVQEAGPHANTHIHTNTHRHVRPPAYHSTPLPPPCKPPLCGCKSRTPPAATSAAKHSAPHGSLLAAGNNATTAAPAGSVSAAPARATGCCSPICTPRASSGFAGRVSRYVKERKGKDTYVHACMSGEGRGGKKGRA